MWTKKELSDEFFSEVFSTSQRYANLGFADEVFTDSSKRNTMEILRGIENKKLPDLFPVYITKGTASYMFRNQIVVRMGFSLINQNFVDALAKYIGDRSCLEVMCGTGALSASLKAKNTNIIATDSFSWETENTGWNKDTRWCEIKEMDAVEAVKRYGADTEFIIMSWPPYNDDTAYKVLIQMREVNPDCRLIYIGESEGGCTANDNFFENAVEIEDDEEFNKVCCFFQRWDCIHDCPRLYK